YSNLLNWKLSRCWPQFCSARRSVQAEWNVARKLVPNASELDSKNSGEEVLNEGPHTGIIDSFACRNRLSGAGHGSVGFQSKGGRTAKTTRRTAQTNEQARGAARRTAKQGDGGCRPHGSPAGRAGRYHPSNAAPGGAAVGAAASVALLRSSP